jgi:hypothetical protein
VYGCHVVGLPSLLVSGVVRSSSLLNEGDGCQVVVIGGDTDRLCVREVTMGWCAGEHSQVSS